MTEKSIEEHVVKEKTGNRFAYAIIFFIAAVIYSIFPIDIIPDILGPIGWVDDIAVWFITLFIEAWLFFKKKPSPK